MDNIALLLNHFPGITDAQTALFSQLPELYTYWNERINVISRKDMDHFMERHVLHSLSIAKYMTLKSGWYVGDLGTGGGFPGIPLAILFPEVQFVLMDSVGKKIKVVEEVAKALNLKNVRAIWGRAEEQKVKLNLVVTRAVAPLPQLIEWSKPLLKPQSQGIIALKGGDLSEELMGLTKRTKVQPLSAWFNEDFFETKVLVHYSDR